MSQPKIYALILAGGKSSRMGEDKALMLDIADFNHMMALAFDELAVHRICAYAYNLANDFNRFYHANKVIGESDAAVREGWIALLELTLGVLEECAGVLAIEAPERM